jgi:hypothetical protein
MWDVYFLSAYTSNRLADYFGIERDEFDPLYYLKDIVTLSKNNLRTIDGFGRKSMADLREFMIYHTGQDHWA